MCMKINKYSQQPWTKVMGQIWHAHAKQTVVQVRKCACSAPPPPHTLLKSDSSCIEGRWGKIDAMKTTKTTTVALKSEFTLFQISSSDSMSFNLSNGEFFGGELNSKGVTLSVK